MSENDVLQLVKYTPETAAKPEYAGADDFHFWCPGCDSIHHIRSKGAPPVWDFNGDMVRPTFSPSHLTGGQGENGERFSFRRCHSFIRDGWIEFLSDCHHALAGKTVPLPPKKDWRYGA